VSFPILVSNQASPRWNLPRGLDNSITLCLFEVCDQKAGRENTQLARLGFLIGPLHLTLFFLLRQARHGTINYFLSLWGELRLKSLWKSNRKSFCCQVLNSTLTLFPEYKVTTISIVLLFTYHFSGQESCEPCKEKNDS
jgi:hypothetical protein